MVTILASFSLFAGILATIAHARNNYESIKSISYFILSLAVLILSMEYFTEGDSSHTLLPLVLIAILSVHFFLGEITKHKTHFIWNFIPIISSTSLLLLPSLENVSYAGFGIDSNKEVFIIALLSSVIPFLTHLAKLGIGNLIIRFGSIKWAENEENYLESLVSYAFIGGIAALGSFLLGNLGLLLAGTFYLSATFIARNKVGLQNDIISAASGSIFLIVVVPIVLDIGGYSSLDFTRGEVLEGAFVAGFMLVIYELLLNLSRHNTGKWKVLLTFKALFIPILAIVLIGFAYTQLERLGGVLSLAAMITSMAIFSVMFTLFKNSNFIGLKLVTVGLTLLLIPYVKPVEQKSSIDLTSLGIESDQESSESNTEKQRKSNTSQKDSPKGKGITNALGEWSIDSESSQISFELGPDDGRTKGAFKKIRGKVTIKETVKDCSMEVTLPVESLTTFNSMRDEHLMEEDYFHEEKYPTMRFVSDSFEKDGDAYIISGTFTMMDIENPLEVRMKLVGVGEQEGNKVAVLWGTSQIDRTKYGMDSSAKIGDIVDFTFEVQLNHEF
jgi:polyisoprenoid-binding protein YceI